MKNKSISPWVAAILNLLLPGLGYVYVGKRIGFGVGLIFSGIILWGFATLSYNTVTNFPLVMWIDTIILSILFAYDGFNTAKEVNS